MVWKSSLPKRLPIWLYACNFISDASLSAGVNIKVAKSARRKTPKERRPPPLDLVSRLERAEEQLTPSEQRIAAIVRLNFEAATRMTIAELARRAKVSQPTVTRFCAALGCKSFADFKLNLATTVTVAAAYLNNERNINDDIANLAHTTAKRATSAIRECLDQLDTETLSEAIAAIAACKRLDIYGQGGGSAAIVEDAKLRFFRLGLPVCAYQDGHQQRMSAATLDPGCCVLAISNSGRSKPVVEAVEIAKSFGARTIALTRPETPLSAAADMVVPVVIPESDSVLLPTPSRYAHLAVIDTLAAGVAIRLGKKALNSLRRVRYTVARIGVAIPAPAADPTPLMSGTEQEE
jgi:DNA-binding MurR/RpiR family transcriptional regulator